MEAGSCWLFEFWFKGGKGGRDRESSRSELNKETRRVSAGNCHLLSRGEASEYATYDLESGRTDEGIEPELTNKQ